jgi:hypothetical protein
MGIGGFLMLSIAGIDDGADDAAAIHHQSARPQ